jgi:tripeptide aminopeptidase
MELNRERIGSTFAGLVEVDSPSRQERQMADTLKELFGKLDITLEEDNAGPAFGGNTGNLFARVKGQLPGTPLLFSAHMDTVEPSRGKKAVFHPDGTITSAGDTVLGADDLGGVTAILEAVRWLKETGTPHRDLELMFSPSEERFSEGTHQFDFSKCQAKLGYVLDLAEDMGAAAIRAPGSIQFWITVHGKAAHAGFAPEEGVHAVAIAAEALSKLQFGHVDPVTTVNIGVIRGGLMPNIVPESCELEGEIRSYQDERIDEEWDKILSAFQDAAEKRGGSVSTRVRRCYKALNTPEDSQVVTYYQKACEKVGLTPKLVGTFGMSDCNHFPQHGIQGVVVSSAMWKCHSTEEYTTLEALCQLTQLVIALMTGEELAQ